MSYFANHAGNDDKKQGKKIRGSFWAKKPAGGDAKAAPAGGPYPSPPKGPAPTHQLNASRVKQPLTRDDLIDSNIEKIQANQDEDFISKYVDKSVAPRRGKLMQPGTSDVKNNVFGPPHISTPPKHRLRPDFDDEALSKLVTKDERKDDAVAAMIMHPTMVDRMDELRFAHPAFAQHKEPKASHKRPSLAVGPNGLIPPEEIPMGVNGFPGMGMHTKVPAKTGRSCKDPEPFIAPQIEFRKIPASARDVTDPITGDRIGIYQRLNAQRASRW